MVLEAVQFLLAVFGVSLIAGAGFRIGSLYADLLIKRVERGLSE